MVEVVPLFSCPIYVSQIDDVNLNFNEISWSKNYNNFISSTQNVLNDTEFAKLMPSISRSINEYFYGVMGVKEQAEIFITESWLNKTDKGQTHHRHWHPNSVISGIVYLQGDETSGFTRFITSRYDQLEFEIENTNIYNSKSWSIEPLKNRILLFPSHVEHLVEEYQSDLPRITLSFNTFVRGNINTLPLTRLSY